MYIVRNGIDTLSIFVIVIIVAAAIVVSTIVVELDGLGSLNFLF